MMLASRDPVPISRKDFDTMRRFVQVMWRLKRHPGYLAGLKDVLPPAAGIEPAAPSVLMGYDFHLTPEGPRLIEINNNAGGLYVGGDEQWLPQPDLPEFDLPGWDAPLPSRLARMFPPEWRCIAIMDEDVRNQFMYPEMCAYAELLRARGRAVFVVSPEEIAARDDGLYVGEARLDAIYNRHTDFYLESPTLAHVRAAYARGQVQLNPHPRSYALLGDKRRMADWWREGFLDALLEPGEVDFIRRIVPECRLFRDMDEETLWRERKAWVFKPAARHGGKGVVLGKGMSRKRFMALDRDDTIVQRYVPPGSVELNGRAFKLDVRLYAHGEKLIALAGRVWRGQVTNFREAGSGWVALEPR